MTLPFIGTLPFLTLQERDTNMEDRLEAIPRYFFQQRNKFSQLEESFTNTLESLSVYNETFLKISSHFDLSLPNQTKQAFQDWKTILFSEEPSWNEKQIALIKQEEIAQKQFEQLQVLTHELHNLQTNSDHNLWTCFS